MPIFDVPAFTRLLDDSRWRWYSDDPATLRGADSLYRSFDLRRDNFAFFDRKLLEDLAAVAESTITAGTSFLDDAAGQLRDVPGSIPISSTCTCSPFVPLCHSLLVSITCELLGGLGLC